MRVGQGRARLIQAAALVAVVLLAACIGDDDDRGDGQRRGEPEAPADTMRLGIGGDLVVDPVEASLASASDLMVLDLLHDGLTRLDADGAPQPALAERWEGNATSTAFGFVLAPGVTFTSGRPITPQDVIASLERVMAAGDTSLAALSLEAVKGFRDFADGKADHVSGLSVANDRTVRIDLTTPLSVLPIVLSSPMMSVVDTETIEGDLADLDLSGAWQVVESDDGDLQLDNRDPEASLAKVELSSHDDDEGAYESFQDGDVDWAEVPADQYDDAVEEYGDAAFAPFQAELFFGMNVKIPALKSAELRNAIVLAIDRQAIVDEVYADLADPLTTIVPAGVPGNDPDRCPKCAYDPDQAADIVAFTFPDGDAPTVRIDFDESPRQEDMAEMVAGDLEDAGIPTELRSKPLDEYEAFVVSGKQELFSFGWIGAYRSPDAYLAPLFSASANDNLTNFRSPAVDALLEGARASTNYAMDAKRWAGAEKLVLQSHVVVPIAQFRTQVVVAERVEGLVEAVDGTVDWAQVSLAS